MKQFTDELESRLHAAAEAQAKQHALSRTAKTLTSAPRLTGSVAVLAAGAVAIVIAVGSGGRPESAVAFPVLSRPAVDASRQPRIGVLRSAGADLQQTRTFETPYGLGYVAEAPGGRLCVAAPDNVPGALAGSCRAIAVAESKGIWLTFIGGDHANDGGSELVAILPSGAPAPRVIAADGSSTTLPMNDGVVVAQFHEDVTVAIEIDGDTTNIPVPLVEPERGRVADCGSGRVVNQARGETYEQACQR